MRYLGGKSKIRKQVAAVLEMLRLPGQTYFEPFVGGAVAGALTPAQEESVDHAFRAWAAVSPDRF